MGANGHKLLVYSYDVERMHKNKIWTKYVGVNTDAIVDEDTWLGPLGTTTKRGKAP